jgi:hypothetical protein
MSGTVSGGKKTAIKNLARDPDFYKKIGAIGGKNSNHGGYASQKVGADGLTGQERARINGVIGGTISKRKPNGE